MYTYIYIYIYIYLHTLFLVVTKTFFAKISALGCYKMSQNFIGIIITVLKHKSTYRYAPHNDVSVNDGPHIRGGPIIL